MTADYGKTWQRIDRGLPTDHFVRVVREDTEREGLLYAGTEGGVFVSVDNGSSWRSLQLNLPVVPVTDLKVHGDDLVAATQGRAFWILDGVQPLRQLTPEVEGAEMHLFEPGEALRLNTGRAWNEPNNNPPYGAVIYYTFASAPDDEVTMQILDSSGAVVRTFSSIASETEDAGFVKGVQGEPPADPLPVKPGQNRYVWNLRVEPMIKVSDTIRYVSNRPYRVGPGEYTVRLTVGDKTASKTLRVSGHPLKPFDPEAWEQQQESVKSLYELVNDIHRATNQMRSVAEQVAAVMDSNSDRTIQRNGKALIEKLSEWEDHVPQPLLPGGLEDRIAYPSHLLSTQVLHVMSIIDQGPPVSAMAAERIAAMQATWLTFEERKQALLANDLAAFNAQVETNMQVKIPVGDEPVSRPYPPANLP